MVHSIVAQSTGLHPAYRQFALRQDFELYLVADIGVEAGSPMQLVFESQDDTLVNFFAGLLENAGIHCQVRNEVVGALGEDLRLGDYPVQLWVLDDSKLQEARQLLKGRVSIGASDHPWRCGTCGEVLESQFSECWKCGEARRDK